MTAKRGLGRGLDALLGDTPVPVGARALDERGLRDIAVASITPNPFQPRKSFGSDALGDLQSSIAQHGVLVPIIVRKRGEGYQLIAGERRWRASAALGRTTIPAIVRESDDRESLEVAIVENLQREDLNPIEEAAGFAQLIEERGLTQEDVAARLGKSRSAITNALRLLTLSDALKALIVARKLSAGHARALLAAPEERRTTLAQRVIDEGLSVRAIERLAVEPPPHAPDVVRAPQRPLSTDERAFETRLRERFGTHVGIVRAGRGGRIELRFSDDGDLLRLGDLLLGEA